VVHWNAAESTCNKRVEVDVMAARAPALRFMTKKHLTRSFVSQGKALMRESEATACENAIDANLLCLLLRKVRLLMNALFIPASHASFLLLFRQCRHQYVAAAAACKVVSWHTRVSPVSYNNTFQQKFRKNAGQRLWYKMRFLQEKLLINAIIASINCNHSR
jgi:hypothetical protein